MKIYKRPYMATDIGPAMANEAVYEGKWVYEGSPEEAQDQALEALAARYDLPQELIGTEDDLATEDESAWVGGVTVLLGKEANVLHEERTDTIGDVLVQGWRGHVFLRTLGDFASAYHWIVSTQAAWDEAIAVVRERGLDQPYRG